MAKRKGIEKLGLTPSTIKALRRAGIRTVENLLGSTDGDLLKISGIKDGRLRKIRSTLRREGLEKK